MGARADRLEVRIERLIREREGPSARLLAVDWRPSVHSWSVWTRYAFVAGATARPEVREVRPTALVLRLNRAKEANPVALGLAGALLPDQAPVYVFGLNDEGVRSVRTLGGLELANLAAFGHGRLLGARWISGLERTLESFRAVTSVGLPFLGARSWVSYPGCFAPGRLDPGTALLLSTLSPAGQDPGRILDFACGTGIVAAEVRARWPGATVAGVDADAIALVAARENVPGVSFGLCGGPGDVRASGLDLVISNPPFHLGRQRDDEVWLQLIARSKHWLRPGGELRMVVQREIAPESALRAVFGSVDCLVSNSRYWVWSAR